MLSAGIISAQSVTLDGQVIADSDVENINVMNITSKVNTITDVQGRFRITAKLHDTIIFSSLIYNPMQIQIDQQTLLGKTLVVHLTNAVNELDEIVLGKILSGHLGDDINNVEGNTPVNFYDVGIPGYTGKLASQSERRLSEASSFKPSGGSSGFGLGAAMQFTPIINAISGRTKMLKGRVLHEAKDDLLHRIKTTIAQDFFKFFPLKKDVQTDFLYFCEADPTFMPRCNQKSDFEIFEFLREKLEQYKKNLNEKFD
ncbi:hypothetical protein GCM10022260_18050 [Gaetbulibacter aestuarii]